MHEELVPPEDTSSHNVTEADWKTEFDVLTTLRELGHDVFPLGIGEDLGVIRRAIDDSKPQIAFNLLEDFHDVAIFDQNVVSYLELLRLPYTGCNPRGLLLARDKALSKQLMAYHRIPVPDSFVCLIGHQPRRPKRLIYPLIVKSLTKEASAGISQASVVDDDDKLRDRVKFVHKTLGTDALIERYIDGRELYVGIIGNQRLQTFPIWELLLNKMPEGAWRIATDRVKWNRLYQQKRGIRTEEAKDIPESIGDNIRHLCRRVYRTLSLSGYARIDMRLDADGKIYVLEANPNPQLACGEDFAASAERSGVGYGSLLQRILSFGLRWRPGK
jgi:D-alanine-D-alanine ligase